MKRIETIPAALLAALALSVGACVNVRTHSTIDPIYMTLDVNLRVQLDQEIENVFGDIDAASNTVE